jgi:large subunit ribosomal protein L17
MKHRVVGRRLDRTTEHRTAMLRNMVTSLFRYERITTTTPKAKELKRFADKIVTLAKKGTPHHRRIANRDVRDVEVLNKLFGTIADRFKARPGGYTRLVRVGRRAGDNAELAVIELLDRAPAEAPAEEEKGAKKAPKAKAEKAKAPKAPKAEKAAKAPKAEKPAKPKAEKKTKKAKGEEK